MSELTLHRLVGTHTEIGEAYGSSCAELVQEHLDLVLQRFAALGVARTDVLAATGEYRGYIEEYAPFLGQEIRGVAAGADIETEEAYLLQLRAEVNQRLQPTSDESAECTTFAALSDTTASGYGLLGQNSDLPPFYERLLVMVHIVPDDGPEILMLTPAGQVSYIGINNAGLGVCANFLSCDGWRAGFPRYLLTRLALQHDSVDGALAGIRGVPRASSRNLLISDGRDRAVDLETTPTADAALEPRDGLLAHANHYVADELSAQEKAGPTLLENSRTRMHRMEKLLAEQSPQLDPVAMAAIMRDRGTAPHAISCVAADGVLDDTVTVGSIIAEPARQRMWAVRGAPTDGKYQQFSMTEPGEPAVL